MEKEDIGGITLMFTDSDKEIKWQLNQLKRNFGISQRFLFFSALFQGIFYWSDVLENDPQENVQLFHLLCLRLLLGTLPLLSCFLVSTGLLLPTQMTIFWVNICYGLPTLAIFYLSRKYSTHWDSLYIVYGLCFFMLPKISPLNFIYGFSGAALFTLLFIYISAFRLRFQAWVLSNTILLILVVLFMYISYSSEKSSRERWLLRERLNRENINLQMVASSIEDDLKKTANKDFALEIIPQQSFSQGFQGGIGAVGMHHIIGMKYQPYTSIKRLKKIKIKFFKKCSHS